MNGDTYGNTDGNMSGDTYGDRNGNMNGGMNGDTDGNTYGETNGNTNVPADGKTERLRVLVRGIACAGEVWEPVSPRDRHMLSNPWRGEDRERLWRPRVHRTARTLAVPLRAADRLVQLRHRHVSVLDHLGHGTRTPEVVAALRAGLPAAAPCYGPRAGPGQPFTCYTATPHDEYEVVGW